MLYQDKNHIIEVDYSKINWNTFFKERQKLYHSPKNKEMLPTVIIISLICIILNNAIVYEVIIWLCYYIYCQRNNEKMNHNPYILMNRKSCDNIMKAAKELGYLK